MTSMPLLLIMTYSRRKRQVKSTASQLVMHLVFFKIEPPRLRKVPSPPPFTSF